MTDHEFHKQLLNLTAALARAASAKPYDPDAYKDIIHELNKLSQMPIHPRHRLPWVAIFTVLTCLLALAILVYSILCPL